MYNFWISENVYGQLIRLLKLVICCMWYAEILSPLCPACNDIFTKYPSLCLWEKFPKKMKNSKRVKCIGTSMLNHSTLVADKLSDSRLMLKFSFFKIQESWPKSHDQKSYPKFKNITLSPSKVWIRPIHSLNCITKNLQGLVKRLFYSLSHMICDISYFLKRQQT